MCHVSLRRRAGANEQWHHDILTSHKVGLLRAVFTRPNPLPFGVRCDPSGMGGLGVVGPS